MSAVTRWLPRVSRLLLRPARALLPTHRSQWLDGWGDGYAAGYTAALRDRKQAPWVK